MKLTIEKIKYGIEFSNVYRLEDYHEKDCCEYHFIDWSPYDDDNKYKGLVIDFETDDFLEEIEDYGICIKPLNSHPIRLAGYGSNNGCYSSNLSLRLINDKGDIIKT